MLMFPCVAEKVHHVEDGTVTAVTRQSRHNCEKASRHDCCSPLRVRAHSHSQSQQPAAAPTRFLGIMMDDDGVDTYSDTLTVSPGTPYHIKHEEHTTHQNIST